MAPQVSDWPLLIPSSASTMILYLLLPALILGLLESQTANTTKEELSKVARNQTFRESNNNSTVKPGNGDELQNNRTSSVITEDDEKFQDQEKELPARHCQQQLLVTFSHRLCGAVFHTAMRSIITENWCVLENIIRPYNDMTVCLEELSYEVGCYYPNPDIQDFFAQIHSHYFQNCSKEERVLVDAPQGLVITLTLIPVSLIPVLVYLVVWKSKVQD